MSSITPTKWNSNRYFDTFPFTLLTTYFKQRGAPHIHGVLWLDLDKLEKINENLVECGEDEPKIFPNLKSAFRKLKADEELTDDDLLSLQNLVESFSTVCTDPNVVGENTARIARQVNMHAHTMTCRKGGREHCRFRFPRFPSDRTIIRKPWRLFNDSDERKKELKLILKNVEDVLQNEEVIKAITESCENEGDYNKRISMGIDLLLQTAKVSSNDYYQALSYSVGYGVVHKRGLEEIFVNPYNIDWLRAWDANIDFSFAFDFHAIITYITDYYSKSEPGLTEALKKALKESNSSQARERMIIAANIYQTHRQIGEAEAAYKLLPSLHLHDSNVTCQWIPTGKESDSWKRMMRINADEEKGVQEGGIKIEGREGLWKPQENITVKYNRRPAVLEQMSKVQFCKMYVKARRTDTEKDDEAWSSEEDSESEETQKPAMYTPGTEESAFYSNYVVQADDNGEMVPGTPLPQWIELSDGTTMKKRSFPQVARYHKAGADKKEAYYLQQLQLFKPHRADDVPKWEENPGVFYLEASKQIGMVSSIVMEHLESVEEARFMVQQLETSADLAEIGIDMDPAGEQDDAEASEEGSHEDEDLENLNPNLHALNKEVHENSLFRKVEFPPKTEMLKNMQKLDKYQQMAVEAVIRHCRDLVKAGKGNKTPEPIRLVVSGGTIMSIIYEYEHGYSDS